MFKPGSIRKIEVTNFVTYTYTEFYPGPNLNMLIGPNGTGKSTMVAAIILGLGGNPKVVGRGTRVSEYVKHNCNDATINIYLQGADEKEFVKITRMFSNQDRTVWAINNKKVPVKNVLDHIKQYNIQVDNLCQFLPQDRVQDFAKLNQKDLLKATQIAVGREDLVEIQQRLIESRENFKNISASIKKSSEKLVEAQNANGRLSSKVENFKTKKKCLTQVQDIVRKTAWVQFDEFYASMSVFKEDLKNATNVHEKYKNEAKPMEKQIQESKKMVTDLQHVGTNITRGIKERESSISNNLEKLDQYQHSISRVRNDMNSKIQAIEQKEKEIETNSTLIELMKVTQKELLDKCGNDEQVQQKLRKVTTEMQKFKNHVKGLQDRRDELSVAKQNHTGQLRAYENEMVRLENVKQQRLEYLRRKDGDAFAAVEWLRANKHMFKGEVFEPMLLEINVLDSKNGLFLENVISFQDQLAFTCVEKEDMNALIKYLRGDKRLTVNVVHSGNTGEPITSFQPAIPIEQLKRYGLYTYLHSLFTAPEPIMRYLCKTYNLHNIPIGDNTTNRYFEDLPHQIRVFFSDKQRYSVSYSKYTGAKSIKQNDIDSSGALSISVDVLRFERLRGQIEEIRHSITTCDEQMSEFSSQINQINEKVSRMGEDLRSIHSVKQQIQSIASRITAMQKKIVELRQSGSSRDAIRNDARKKIQKIVNDMSGEHVNIKSEYQHLCKLSSKKALNGLKTEHMRRKLATLESQIEESRRLCQEAEKLLHQVKEAFAKAKGHVRATLQKARGLSKDFAPDEPGFQEFRESYDALPSNLEELLDLKNRFLSRIDCLHAANDNELQEYENRVKLIEDLQAKNENAHVDLSKVKCTMERLKEEWLGPLKRLILEINLKFGTAFERMGCAGEVSLNAADGEEEYAQYGLCIKVTYRDGEPLQELNGVVQSGGERAVATAAFMLSLQELTPVPFRCVDEINQGMDSTNERKIFELLVESTSQPNTAQYFLITPKLIPNLTYSSSTVVHIVHNGPFVEEDRKWSSSRLCNYQKVQIH